MPFSWVLSRRATDLFNITDFITIEFLNSLDTVDPRHNWLTNGILEMDDKESDESDVKLQWVR